MSGPPPTAGAETYLGDGLYASFDGVTIILRAPREGGDHWIALEPAVFVALSNLPDPTNPEVWGDWIELTAAIALRAPRRP